MVKRKYKLGDRVLALNDEIGDDEKSNLIGVVRRLDPDCEDFIGIEFDEDIDGHYLDIDGDEGVLDDKRGWWITYKKLKLLPASWKERMKLHKR